MPSRTRLTFYGGLGEIGGNKILLDDGETRIFLDFGKSFSKRSNYYDWTSAPRFIACGLRDFLSLGIIPRMGGIYRRDLLGLAGMKEEEDRSVDAVVISHAHSDHLDHVSFLREDIPIWMGETAKRIAISLEDEKNSNVEFEITEFKERPIDRKASPIQRQINTFTTNTGEFSINSIHIEPVHVDHSVPGCYGFIVRTRDRTVVYTGDLRMHGNKSEMTRDFIERAKESRPDLMICEGTRANESTKQTEKDVSDGCRFYVEQAANHFVVLDYSYKDVDRFTTFFRIAKGAGRKLLINPKTARYIRALARDNPRIDLPSPDDENIGIYMPMKEGGYEEDSYSKADREFLNWPNVWTAKEVKEKQSSVMLSLSSSSACELIDIEPAGGLFIHSMSEPFNEEGEFDEKRTKRWMEKFELEWVQSHCSGHASGVDLNHIVNEISPRKVVPVHTETPGIFGLLQRDRVAYASPEVPFPVP